MRQITVILLAMIFLFPASLTAEEKKTREQKVREDQQKVAREGFWIYNDLPAAFEKARTSGKPLLVVLRYIPCEECVKLDDDHRRRGQPIPEDVQNPYPHPRSLGMILDPTTRATLKAVNEGSLAAKAGLITGDQIVSLNGQPILSMADVQWVLHRIPASGGKLQMGIVRGESDQVVTLELAEGWRRLDDISWRASSWGLRRMVTGGLVLVSLSAEERKTLEQPAGGMALRIKHVGQYGAHAAGKNAGFQTDDVLVSYDGRTDLMTDSDVLRYGVTARQSGGVVAVEILRGSERKTLKLPMQE